MGVVHGGVEGMRGHVRMTFWGGRASPGGSGREQAATADRSGGDRQRRDCSRGPRAAIGRRRGDAAARGLAGVIRSVTEAAVGAHEIHGQASGEDVCGGHGVMVAYFG
jgi:hypothetical protein